MNNEEKNTRIAIIGGDIRQLTVAKEFSQEGFSVKIFGFDNSYENDYGDIEKCETLKEAVEYAKIVILPLPCTIDGTWLNCPFTKKEIKIDEIIEYMDGEKILIGGKISEKIKEKAEKKGIMTIDYYNREELMIRNAIPTAEGAISIAMQEVPFTLHSSKCAVIGFGRIGKILSKDLRALGACVCVFARSFSSFAWINAYDIEYKCINDMESDISEYDIIFNTVPKRIFDEKILKKLKKGALLIDLASAPGGVDMDYAKTNRINVIWALSLPGKVAPLTAGKIIKESIENSLLEGGIEI